MTGCSKTPAGKKPRSPAKLGSLDGLFFQLPGRDAGMAVLAPPGRSGRIYRAQLRAINHAPGN